MPSAIGRSKRLESLGNSQARGDRTAREFEGAVERRAHAIARLAHLRIGQPDDVKGGQAGAEVNLDAYFGRINTRARGSQP